MAFSIHRISSEPRQVRLTEGAAYRKNTWLRDLSLEMESKKQACKLCEASYVTQYNQADVQASLITGHINPLERGAAKVIDARGKQALNWTSKLIRAVFPFQSLPLSATQFPWQRFGDFNVEPSFRH